MPLRRLGVLTAGGDAPGLNPALKAATYRASDLGVALVGLYDGWEGLLDGPNGEHPEALLLEPPLVRTWDRDGGSHLGCSRTNPLRVARGERRVDASEEILRNAARLQLDGVIVMGGPDALGVALRLHERGLRVVAVPKSITRELGGTDHTLGFDTSFRTCADIIERSRTSAGTRRWVQVVEVMGAHCGHLAFWSALAGGAQIVLIPEHPFELARLYALIEDRLDRPPFRGTRTPRYATVVVAEGASPRGGHAVRVASTPDDYGHERVGGLGALLAERIRTEMRADARAVALGHPQRGGAPSAVDRGLAFVLGSAAVDACAQGRWGTIVGARGAFPIAELEHTPLVEALANPSRVDVARWYDTDRYFPRRNIALL